MTTAAKIVALLAEAGYDWPGGPANAKICRTRAGWDQRAAGAWSWFLMTVDGQHVSWSVGSQWPATRIAKGPTTVTRHRIFRQYELDPK